MNHSVPEVIYSKNSFCGLKKHKIYLYIDNSNSHLIKRKKKERIRETGQKVRNLKLNMSVTKSNNKTKENCK